MWVIDGLNRLIGWKTYRDRLALFLFIILFGLVIADSRGVINIEKWGYAAFGGYIAWLIMFYFRKVPDSEKKPEGTPQ